MHEMKLCSACRRPTPPERIKLYKTPSGVRLHRCNDCQDARLKNIEERKDRNATVRPIDPSADQS